MGLEGLIAEHLIALNECGAAMRLLHSTLTNLTGPPSWVCLLAQARLLLDRGRERDAVSIAREAVHCAPCEADPWLLLCEALIQADEPQAALLCLNSCPAATRQPRSVITVISPLPPITRLANIDCDIPLAALFDASYLSSGSSGSLGDYHSADEHVDEAIFGGLRAGRLVGTAAHAYRLLSTMAQRFGWDALLGHRSLVFWMEDAYQQEQKRQRSGSSATVDMPDGGGQAASEKESEQDKVDPPVAQDIPVVPPRPKNMSVLLQTSQPSSNVTLTLRRPDNAQLGSGTGNSSRVLSERWLDDLFRFLYDDMCAFALLFPCADGTTSPRLSLQSPSVAPGLSRREYMLAGDIAFRLHYRLHARAAYHAALHSDRGSKFSRHAYGRIAEISAENNDRKGAVAALAMLAVEADFDPAREIFPSSLARASAHMCSALGSEEHVELAVQQDTTVSEDRREALLRMLGKVFSMSES